MVKLLMYLMNFNHLVLSFGHVSDGSSPFDVNLLYMWYSCRISHMWVSFLLSKIPFSAMCDKSVKTYCLPTLLYTSHKQFVFEANIFLLVTCLCLAVLANTVCVRWFQLWYQYCLHVLGAWSDWPVQKYYLSKLMSVMEELWPIVHQVLLLHKCQVYLLVLLWHWFANLRSFEIWLLPPLVLVYFCSLSANYLMARWLPQMIHFRGLICISFNWTSHSSSLYLGDCPYLVASWFEKILDIWISGCFDGLALLPDPVMHTSGLSNLHPPLIFFRFGDYSFT
jgi:hypothetical protein